MERWMLRTLLERFWITREEDRELYYSLKRTQMEYRQFLNERLGWNLFINEAVVKLEKTPPEAAPWMGIPTFQDTLDYCLLCALLLFLADLDDGEAFLLSTLTASIKSYLAELRPVDWTRFSDRKALVRVLQYAGEMRLLLEFDGNSEGFGRSQDQEVLYENTGLSRHFPTHFGQDILSCRSPEDFQALLREAEDSRRVRTHRVYQQLSLCPAIYAFSGGDGDFDYVKNQRTTLERHLDEALGGELHVHRSGAFFALNEGDAFGQTYPGRMRTAEKDVMLLLCGQIRAKAGTVYPKEKDDTVALTWEAFQAEVAECRERWAEGWGRMLRELPAESLCRKLEREMVEWSLLEEREGELVLLPAGGKWTGRYPLSFCGKGGGGQGGAECRPSIGENGKEKTGGEARQRRRKRALENP